MPKFGSLSTYERIIYTLQKSTTNLDDERGGGGDDLDLGLPVLDDELNGDFEALPVLRGLGDVVADLLGGEAERAHLGGQGRRGGNFSAHGPQAHGLEFG